MRDRVYRTEALIIRRQDIGEADRLLVIATPHGKQRVITRSARKTSSRLAGHTELFTHATLMLAIGRTFAIVTQSQVIHSFPGLRTDLPRLGLAYYAVELYDTFTQEEEPDPHLFQLLLQTFSALDTSVNPHLVLRMYELRLLHNMGYRPHLHRCAVCRELLTQEASRFSPASGGVLCIHHRDADPHALPMSLNAFKLLRYLQTRSLAMVEHVQLSVDLCTEVELLLRAYMRHILERELKSVAFLDYMKYDLEL